MEEWKGKNKMRGRIDGKGKRERMNKIKKEGENRWER